MFSSFFFLINFLIFENFDQKGQKKITFWPKFQFFGPKIQKFKKIRNLSKKVRKYSLDACI